MNGIVANISALISALIAQIRFGPMKSASRPIG